MEDILLNIGSIVKVKNDDEVESYLIVGKRIINFRTMKAWDYYSVPYPEGQKKDKEGNDDNGFYFNHTSIEEVVYQCEIENTKEV